MSAETAVKNCPACGSDEISHGQSWPPSRGSVECHADGCGVITVACSGHEAITLWNRGVWTHELVERDADGQPIYRIKREGA